MRRNSNNFRNMLKEFKTLRHQLSEDYVFNGEDDDYGYGDEDMMQQQDPRMNMQQRMGDEDQEGGNEDDEERAVEAQETLQHEPIIGKIRETAIEGLKKYSDNPTSKIYEFFKKVFLESDKVLTDGASK